MMAWFRWAALLGVCGPISAAMLTLERTIPLPGVGGRIDHFAADPDGGRLFVAALGAGTVAVIDLAAGKVAHSIRNLAEPQGIFFLGGMGRLYVASGGDGAVHVFDGTTLAPLALVKFDSDADNIRYDGAARLLYVGHGDGALGAVDVTDNRVVADVPLAAHPESFQLERNSPRAFVNVPRAHEIAVIDRSRKAVVARWPVGPAANFPMALDEAHHRLLIGCRTPARLVVLDTETGREAANLALHGDCDDLFLDRARSRIYASCGEGFIDVFAQVDADHYAPAESVATERGARTCFLDGDHLYLAVPRRGGQSAEVRCYRVGGQIP